MVFGKTGEDSMGIRRRVVAISIAAMAGLALAGGAATAASASVDTGNQAVQLMNFWFLHSSYDTQGECEAAAQEYLWPNNPAGADDYECRASADGWDLWLMFLS